MKKVVLFLILLLSISTFAQLPKETNEQKAERMKWWTDARFGMFIHWGLYSMPARHEWVKNHERIKDENYQKYFELYNPDLFEPKEWARLAKQAGMKYFVITAKHHEGFCNWDSKYTDYKITNTAFKRDALKELIEAMRAEGIKVGLYYSLIDWHHPDFTIDPVHPLYSYYKNDKLDSINAKRDMAKYRQYMKNQITELLTSYGEISILWLDFSYREKGQNEWGSTDLLKLIRKLQPNILVNDRLDLKNVEGGWDFTTPEQFVPAKWPEINGKRVAWESCQTFSGSWGYHRDENTWKSPDQLISMLIENVSKGGNLILNVGPTSRGCFDYRAQDRLKAMGEWMKYNGRSIYGCTQAPDEFKCPDNCVYTYNPTTKRLYLHLLNYPLGEISIEGLKDKVKYAQFLHDGSEIRFHGKEKYGFKENELTDVLQLALPTLKPNTVFPVVELFLK
jgi:alpha-L-fucosidase